MVQKELLKLESRNELWSARFLKIVNGSIYSGNPCNNRVVTGFKTMDDGEMKGVIIYYKKKHFKGGLTQSIQRGSMYRSYGQIQEWAMKQHG